MSLQIAIRKNVASIQMFEVRFQIDGMRLHRTEPTRYLHACLTKLNKFNVPFVVIHWQNEIIWNQKS